MAASLPEGDEHAVVHHDPDRVDAPSGGQGAVAGGQTAVPGAQTAAALRLVADELGVARAVLVGADEPAPADEHIDVPLVRDGIEWAILRVVGPSAAERTANPLVRSLITRLVLDGMVADVGETGGDGGDRAAVAQVLADNSLEVVLQPIVALDSERIVGVEALSRFPAHANRSTERWFALADAAGLGVELEAAALRRAITVLDDLADGVYLSVNLSPCALLSDELHEILSEAPLDRVVLEITEHARVADYEALADALQPFRARGARVAVDDTGSGFASMRHVLRLEPEIVKLDSSLTHHIDGDAVLRALGYTLKTFAGAIGAETVAEGIENERELYALRFLGVPYGQGFFLHETLDIDPATWPAQMRVSRPSGG
jgi:EAL domain-containing protein (putative c-di-GMP-specific phosphodiesterase class I)